MAKSRIFHVVSKTHNPETGEKYLDEEKIKDALNHRTIKRWGYALHDKDVYNEADELEDPKHRAGEHKDDHWHIVLEMKSNQQDVDTIAKWFGIPANMIDIAKGRGAFLDCVEYLTHENPKECGPVEAGGNGKHRYADEEVFANFDFRAELDKRLVNKAKYGKDLTLQEQWRFDVRYNGKTLRECRLEDNVQFIEDEKRLRELRIGYLSEQPAPSFRFNFYVQGRGGLGKGLMCRALARSLFPHLAGHDDDEIFFETGAPGVAFEGYDGQPVIIWNDRRHTSLLKELKGRENVFNVFDTHPTRQRQNVKFGSISLVNTFNIVNSVEPYDEFLDGLVARRKGENGDYEQEEDKGQSYRRFPFIIPLHEDDFDFLLNKGFMEGTAEFTEYIAYEHIRGNMQRIAERCKNNERLARALENQVLEPVIGKVLELQARYDVNDEMTEEEEQAILAEFADYGKSLPPAPAPVKQLPENYAVKDGAVYDNSINLLPGETWPDFVDKLQRVAASGSSALLGFLIGRGIKLGELKDFGLNPDDFKYTPTEEEKEIFSRPCEVCILEDGEDGREDDDDKPLPF